MNRKTTNLICILIFFSINVNAKVLTDEEKLNYSFANIEKKEIIFLSGKNLKELMDSIRRALVTMTEEEQKELLRSIKVLIRVEIEKEKNTLINRSLTKEDLEEIKYEAINGKTVLDINEKAKVILDKEKKERLKKEKMEKEKLKKEKHDAYVRRLNGKNKK